MGQLASKAYKRAFGPSDKRVIMFGLDAAGKTTILYKLKLGEVVTTIPTIGFNVETIEYKCITFTIWDTGLRDKARPLLRHYMQPPPDAIILVVDSNDRDRIEQVKEYLDFGLGCLEEDANAEPPAVLVFMNKQDLPNAMSVAEMAEKLNLDRRYGAGRRDWRKQIFAQACKAEVGDGLYEGLDWLSRALSGKGRASQAPAAPARPVERNPVGGAASATRTAEVAPSTAGGSPAARQPPTSAGETLLAPPEDDDAFLAAFEEACLPPLGVWELWRIAYLHRSRISGFTARLTFEASKRRGYVLHATRSLFWISRVYRAPLRAAKNSHEFLAASPGQFPKDPSSQEVMLLRSHTQEALAEPTAALAPVPPRADLGGELASEWESDESFLRRVEAAEVAEGELDSFGQLTRLAFALLQRCEQRREAIRRMDAALRRLAEGWVPPTGTERCVRPFHETLQYAALQLAHAALAANAGAREAMFAEVATACPDLLTGETLAQYYSDEALARGREIFVVPDLKPLPSVIAYAAPTWHKELTDEDFLAALQGGSLTSLGTPSLARYAYLCLRQGRRPAITSLLAAVKKAQEGGSTDPFAHETLAYFILHMVHYCSLAADWSIADQPFPKFVERCGQVADPRLYREYYSDALLFSAAARSGLVLPDLSPLPDLVPRGPAMY